MDNECKRKLAANILLAAEKREESWTEGKQAPHYAKSCIASAQMVCSDDAEEAQLIGLLLAELWANALDWANKVLVQAEGGKDD